MLALLALASSAAWGTSDFFAGLKARSIAPPAVVGVTQSAALIALTLILLVRNTGFSPSFVGNAPLWSIAAGLSGAAGLIFFYTALASGTMGVVAPIASLGALVPVLLGMLTGEQPGRTAWAGMAVAVTGAALASGPGRCGAMPSGPGPIPEKLISEIAQGIPPGVASFLLTSEQAAARIISQQRFCRPNTIQLVDRSSDSTHEDLRRELVTRKHAMHTRGWIGIEARCAGVSEATLMAADGGTEGAQQRGRLVQP